jgi:hypothetical protein
MLTGPGEIEEASAKAAMERTMLIEGLRCINAIGVDDTRGGRGLY